MMHWLLILSTSLLALVLTPILRFLYWKIDKRGTRPKTVAVVVLGDVGRSPRMMYHAQSFAREGFQTFIIGYFDSQLPNMLVQLPMAHKVPLTPFPKFPRVFPFITLAPFKVLWLFLGLFNSLTNRLPYIPDFIVVQVHVNRKNSQSNKHGFASERIRPAYPPYL
jgi:beta-1,4-mannosyltransferase